MRRDALLLILLLGACDGAEGDDATDDETDGAASLEGVYQVTSDARAGDCATWEEEAFPLPFFHVVQVGDVLEVRDCRAEDDCNDYAEPDRRLQQGPAGGWRLVRAWSGHQAESNSCAFHARRTTLSEPADGTVALTSTEVEMFSNADAAASQEACDALLEQLEWSFDAPGVDCWKLTGTRAP